MPARIDGEDVDSPIFHGLHILQAGDRISGSASDIRALAGHYADLPSDPSHADAIIPNSPNRARHMGPMPFGIPGVCILIDRVDAVAIIDVAIAIVIPAVVVTIRTVP